MLKRKKLYSLIIVAVMILSLASCGKKDDTKDSDGSNTITSAVTDTPTQVPTEEPTPEPPADPTPEALPPAGSLIDFEDGNYGFIALDTAPGDADESVLEIVDFNGSKALKVDVQNDKTPYIGIDAASLVGDKITDIRSIEMSVYVEDPSGKFIACSGYIYAYSGVDRVESSDPWSVYLDTQNPKTVVGKLDSEAEYFIAGAQNLFIMTKLSTNNGKSSDMVIDNIIFRDANGEAIPVDTTVGFDKPAGFGAADWSNLTILGGETTIEGATGTSSGAWGQAVTLTTIKNDGGVFDPVVLTPGSVVTVYYSSDVAPELVLQSWTEGRYATSDWAKVAASAVNDSGTIAQYTYDSMVAAFGGEDLVTYLDKLMVGDCGAPLTVSKVTIGTGLGSEVAIEGAIGTSTGTWGQAVTLRAIKNDGGTFDPSFLTKGCVVSVYYASEIAPELVLQSWTDGRYATAGWAKVAASYVNDEGTMAQYTYDDMVAAFGGEDFVTYLDNFIVGDCGAALEVSKVTIIAGQ